LEQHTKDKSSQIVLTPSTISLIPTKPQIPLRNKIIRIGAYQCVRLRPVVRVEHRKVLTTSQLYQDNHCANAKKLEFSLGVFTS